MKKILNIVILLAVFQIINADTVVDSLKKVIDSLPYSYEKGDKIWDLAIYQQNSLMQPNLAIKNFNKASQIFAELDSLESAMRTNASIFKVAFVFPEHFPDSKKAFEKHFQFIDNENLAHLKRFMIINMQRHLTNAYFLKDMDHLKEGLERSQKYFEDNQNDDLKLEFTHLFLLITNYFYGEEKALEKSLEVYRELENDGYNFAFAVRELARIKLLSTMQNFHYYRGNIEQSNKLLDEAIDISKNLSKNHIDELSKVQKLNLQTSISHIMTLKTDNIQISNGNLTKIEEGYLDVNKYAKSFDPERSINNFTKIAHAYDVIYTGKHPKIKYYLDKAEADIDNIQNKLYVTNFYLTKARYLLNLKEYDKANSAFVKVEEFIDKSNQSWLKFNYIMERSRFYFEQNKTKTAYDMITDFYKSIDKDFSNDIAEKTAELNNQLETQKLVFQQAELENELKVKSLQNSRETLVTTLVGIVLGFTTLLLVNNVRMNKKLKKNLHKQGSRLKEEIEISQKRAEELIVSEKLSTSGQIASSIAHEIKNPLTNIITAAKLMYKTKNEEERHKYYGICERNSWLAIDKINALLEYSKKKKMNFLDYSLKTVMKDAYNLSKGTLQENNVELKMIYTTHDDVCRIDPKEISGVLVNLIMNSIQAMDEKNNNRKIEASLSNDEDYYIISISDNGEGIAENKLDKIFNPFFTTKDTGTGLGLSYAEKVIIEHGGRIEIQSELGRGTKVTVKLLREQLD